MEHLRLLYKANPLVLSPKNCKRKMAHEIRAMKRSELYSKTRNVSPSPTSTNPLNLADKQKENCKPTPMKEETPAICKKESETNLESETGKINEKLSRQQAYLMRYLAWKAEKNKKAELKVKNPMRAPFVVPTGCAGAAESRNFKKSFAPKNHIFHPPDNLRNSKIEAVGMNSIRCTNGTTHDTYRIVETPKKKRTVVYKEKELPLKQIISKDISQKASVMQKLTASKTEQKASLPNINNKKTQPPASRQTPHTGVNAKQPKSTVGADSRVRKTSARLKEIPPSQQPALKHLEKPKQIMAVNVKERTQTSKTVASKAATRLGNCKPDLPSLKRTTFKASKKPSTSISTALLAMNKSTRSKTIKLNANTLLGSMVEVTKFAKTATDTKKIAPITNNPLEDCRPKPAVEIPQKNDQFNFIRYSIVQTAKEHVGEEAMATPEKIAGPPTTYLSPFVSVSRGKVSTKIEKEKRNSIYMVEKKPTTTALEMTTTVERTLATVRYYRKQLTEEINRLNDQCYIWELYKEANAKLIEDAVDMIVVTIGQTKLLTSKKLKQFGSLIDRCEDGVLGKNNSTFNDGSEGTKPILPEDLEGFWCMVGLQIENVDKRFAELERWKVNNWTDPDAASTKATTSQVDVKKRMKRKAVTTARPNNALQKMLKSVHAAYLNKKASGTADEDVILTPSKNRHVLIRDRRSRSAAATVITLNSPRSNRMSPANGTPKLSSRKSLNLLKTTLLSGQLKKSPVADCPSPLRNQTIVRKSILKTPASKCKPKSVVFNSPTQKFTIEDMIDEKTSITNDKHTDGDRAYKLRNRRIVLRDSAEFTIPKW